MYGYLGGRKFEDQPVGAGVDVRVVEYVAEEGPIGIGVVTVDDDVATVDHAATVMAAPEDLASQRARSVSLSGRPVALSSSGEVL
jgi:hypothetical protein